MRVPCEIVPSIPARWAYCALKSSVCCRCGAALRFATQEHEGDLALRLGSTMWDVWNIRGPLTEGLHWLTTILALGDRGPTDDYLRCVHGACTLATSLGARGDRRWRGIALVNAADLQEQRKEALAAYEHALVLFHQLGNTGWIATTLLNMGRRMALGPHAHCRTNDRTSDTSPWNEVAGAIVICN